MPGPGRRVRPPPRRCSATALAWRRGRARPGAGRLAPAARPAHAPGARTSPLPSSPPRRPPAARPRRGAPAAARAAASIGPSRLMCRRACSLVHGTICLGGRDPASVSASTWANLPGQLPSGPRWPSGPPPSRAVRAVGWPALSGPLVRWAAVSWCAVVVSWWPVAVCAGPRLCPGGPRPGTRRRKEARNRAPRACGPRSRRAAAGPRRAACPGQARAAAPAAAARLGTAADGWRAGLAAACHELYSEPVTFPGPAGLACPGPARRWNARPGGLVDFSWDQNGSRTYSLCLPRQAAPGVSQCRCHL